jgi:ATP-dependent RNA circularization protein (DNA/RNA ligase family)
MKDIIEFVTEINAINKLMEGGEIKLHSREAFRNISEYLKPLGYDYTVQYHLCSFGEYWVMKISK